MTSPASAAGLLCSAVAILFALTASAAPPVNAQVPPTHASYLRIDFGVEPAKGGRMKISGYVYNSWDKWATDVRILVEALDGSGQPVGSTSASVYGKVPPGNRSYFDAPLTATGVSYRVTVQSADWRTFGAGGG
jgi:hypothetical protein